MCCICPFVCIPYLVFRAKMEFKIVFYNDFRIGIISFYQIQQICQKNKDTCQMRANGVRVNGVGDSRPIPADQNAEDAKNAPQAPKLSRRRLGGGVQGGAGGVGVHLP